MKEPTPTVPTSDPPRQIPSLVSKPPPRPTLDNLPIEILQPILRYLPTLSSINNVSLVNQTLHAKISSEEDTIFRGFIQESFPSIQTPPLWRDAVCALTSRSRAWDRRSFIARQVIPSSSLVENSVQSALFPRSSPIYGPVIDSYGEWQGPRWSDSKDVLAWSYLGRLWLRINQKQGTRWATFQSQLDEHNNPGRDIVDVKLLRHHQKPHLDKESVVISRHDAEIIRLDYDFGSDSFEVSCKYQPTDPVLSTDISQSTDPLLAVCTTKSIELFPVHSSEATVNPVSTIPLLSPFVPRKHGRAAKFVTPNVLAMPQQVTEGHKHSPIHIYDISQPSNASTPLASLGSFVDHWTGSRIRSECANVLATLPTTSLSTNDYSSRTLLSGWTDGITRLHDLRDPSSSLNFVDNVDGGQIFSLLPIGRERFLVGSHQNACLKSFDLRMPGGRVYDYLDARPAATGVHENNKPPKKTEEERGLNIFLSLPVPRNRSPVTPIPIVITNSTYPYTAGGGGGGGRNHPASRLERYRGSIYSLSTPTPYSPTVYVGIDRSVMQLDFHSTDDVLSNTDSNPIQPRREGEEERKFKDILPTPDSLSESTIHPLSAYLRPRPSHPATDPVLLRHQIPWDRAVRLYHSSSAGRRRRKEQRKEIGDEDAEWDLRWRVAGEDDDDDEDDDDNNRVVRREDGSGVRDGGWRGDGGNRRRRTGGRGRGGRGRGRAGRGDSRDH